MSSRKKFVFTLCFFILMIAAILLFGYYNNPYNRQKRYDLKQLATQEYDSIFCSMYSISTFSHDDFTAYRGLNTLKLDSTLNSLSDMNQYLSKAFASGNSVTNVYLGLDPEQLANNLENSVSEKILQHAAAHPETTFHVLLPSHSLEYWVSKSPQTISETLKNYNTLIDLCNQYSNIYTFYPGAESWLISNPGNYSSPTEINVQIAQKILLYCFCDFKYQLTSENASDVLTELQQLILTEQENPTTYPDFSATDIVFFGDSVIGNYTTSASVPGVITGLTDAVSYNCAKGGAPAANIPGTEFSFSVSVDFFLSKDPSTVAGTEPFYSSFEQYLSDNHSNRKLCFVINYGLNDYFFNCPIENENNPWDDTTYMGALRTGITKLQSAYPDASIILLTPYYVDVFLGEVDISAEQSNILTDYVDAALQVAQETNVLSVNCYDALNINAENYSAYLEDGCHLNETGRYLLANQIIRCLNDR